MTPPHECAEDLRILVEHLRAAMAYEARVVEAQTLDVKALGKGRRRVLAEQVQRMRRVALGAPHDKRWSSGFRTELSELERRERA
jgi:hypothetical protein